MKKVCVVNFWDGAFDGDFFEFFFSAAFGGIDYVSIVKIQRMIIMICHLPSCP